MLNALPPDLTNDGDDLFDGQWQFLVPDDHATVAHVTGPWAGLSGPGGDGAVFPWRYWVKEAPSVSSYKPAPRTRHHGPASSPS